MSFFSSKPTAYCVAVRTEPGGIIYTDTSSFVSPDEKPTSNEHYALVNLGIDSAPMARPSKVSVGYTTIVEARRGHCKMICIAEAVWLPAN